MRSTKSKRENILTNGNGYKAQAIRTLVYGRMLRLEGQVGRAQTWEARAEAFLWKHFHSAADEVLTLFEAGDEEEAWDAIPETPERP